MGRVVGRGPWDSFDREVRCLQRESLSSDIAGVERALSLSLSLPSSKLFEFPFKKRACRVTELRWKRDAASFLVSCLFRAGCRGFVCARRVIRNFPGPVYTLYLLFLLPPADLASSDDPFALFFSSLLLPPAPPFFHFCCFPSCVLCISLFASLLLSFRFVRWFTISRVRTIRARCQSIAAPFRNWLQFRNVFFSFSLFFQVAALVNFELGLKEFAGYNGTRNPCPWHDVPPFFFLSFPFGESSLKMFPFRGSVSSNSF